MVASARTDRHLDRDYNDREYNDDGNDYSHSTAYYEPPPVYVRPELVYYQPAPQEYYQPVRVYSRHDYYQGEYVPR